MILISELLLCRATWVRVLNVYYTYIARKQGSRFNPEILLRSGRSVVLIGPFAPINIWYLRSFYTTFSSSISDYRLISLLDDKLEGPQTCIYNWRRGGGGGIKLFTLSRNSWMGLFSPRICCMRVCSSIVWAFLPTCIYLPVNDLRVYLTFHHIKNTARGKMELQIAFAYWVAFSW